MTKSTITRERIQRIIRAINSEAYDEEEIREWLSSDEIMELSRMALAAMDSEPVAEVLSNRPGNDTSTIDMALPVGTQLYRHAQQPVVPDERDKTVDADDHPLLWSFNEGWNACRAAMLAAAPQLPGSEPATVPGKWIPVSERMPEVGDIVLTAIGGAVNVGEMECSAANCRFFTSVISGRELPATHWMPMPSAPQEVK